MSGTMVHGTATSPRAECGRILVVDDERSMRELLQIVLRREGHQVAARGGWPGAVATLEREAG